MFSKNVAFAEIFVHSFGQTFQRIKNHWHNLFSLFASIVSIRRPFPRAKFALYFVPKMPSPGGTFTHYAVPLSLSLPPPSPNPIVPWLSCQFFILCLRLTDICGQTITKNETPKRHFSTENATRLLSCPTTFPCASWQIVKLKCHCLAFCPHFWLWFWSAVQRTTEWTADIRAFQQQQVKMNNEIWRIEMARHLGIWKWELINIEEKINFY